MGALGAAAGAVGDFEGVRERLWEMFHANREVTRKLRALAWPLLIVVLLMLVVMVLPGTEAPDEAVVA